MRKNILNISLLFLAITIGALGCNPGIIDVPPPTLTDVSQYFWNGSSPAATYRNIDSSGKVLSTFTLSFLDSINQNSFNVYESANSLSDILTCISNSDSVNVIGLTTHSVIPLPDGYSIKSGSSTQTIITKLPLHHIIAVSASVAIASNNDSGIYVSTNYGRSWNKSATSYISRSNPITIFASMNGIVYAGTYSGILIVSTDKGKSWSIISSLKNTSPIVAAATDAQQNLLYLSMNDGSIYFGSYQTKFTQLTTQINGLKFKALAVKNINKASGLRTILGGSDSGLYYRQMSDSLKGDWIPVKNYETTLIQSLLSGSSVYGFFLSTLDAIDSSADGISNWNLIRNAASGILAFDSTDNRVISWTHQGSLQDILNQNTLIPSPGNINDLSIAGGNIYTATDSGVAVLMSNTSKWFDTSVVTITSTTGSNLPGSVMLLHSVSGTTSADSTWFAGTLMNTQSKISFPFTAKLIDHLNSVSMPDSSSYSDVIEVQYTLGTSGQNTALPYLQIYFAKGIGPIIIREIYNGVVIRKIYRWKI